VRRRSSGDGLGLIGWAPLLIAWSIAGLRVETETPDALCPDLGQVRAAARARLGDIEGPGEWLASYALVHRPDAPEGGDVIRIDLRDPAGRLRLHRELGRTGESCASLASAVVVVLDGYFRQPAQAAGVAGASPAGATDAATSAAASRSGPASSPAVVDAAAGWVGGGRSSPALALGLRLGLGRSRWWVGVQGAWALHDQTETIASDSPGAARLTSYAVRGFLARALLRTDRVEVFAGPEILLALDRVDGAALPGGASGLRAGWGGGARAQIDVRLARRFSAVAQAAVDVTPAAWGGSLVVDGPNGATEIFHPAAFRALIAGGLSLAMF
jgi:hypothetical protein